MKRGLLPHYLIPVGEELGKEGRTFLSRYNPSPSTGIDVLLLLSLLLEYSHFWCRE